MTEKVTDSTKIVTDSELLKELGRLNIDKDFVEFTQDYAPREKGKQKSPYAKFYKDLKSNKGFMVTSGLPKVKSDGTKIQVGWDMVGNKFISKANLFSAVVEGGRVSLTCLSDQPNGTKEGDSVAWNPQLFVKGKEVEPKAVSASLQVIDPDNEGYLANVLEWDYGVCTRRLRLIEGRIREKWIFPKNPKGDVRIKHNVTGDIPLRFGSGIDADGEDVAVEVVDDEERIAAKDFDTAVFPIRIGASPETFYPDDHVESTSVDGSVRHVEDPVVWATLVAGAGTHSGDSNDSRPACGLQTSQEDNTKWRTIRKGIFLFDTSALPDAATVTAATLSLYGDLKKNDNGAGVSVNVYSSNPAANNAIVPGDYDSLGSTAFCDTPIAYAGFNLGTPGSANDFVFNATGLAAIDKEGITKLGTRMPTYDVGETIPAHGGVLDAGDLLKVWNAEKGTGYKPKLVVTYTTEGAEYIRSGTVLLGLLGVESRVIAYSRSDTSLLGLLPSYSKNIAFSRGETGLLGLLPSYSKNIALSRSETALLGLLSTASRAVSFTRTNTVLLGLKGTATRVMGVVREDVAQIGLLTTATTSRGFSRLATALLGLSTSATRTIVFTRTKTALLGLKTTAPVVVVFRIGRSLLIKVITSSYRSIDVKTSQYRLVRVATALYRKINVFTLGR